MRWPIYELLPHWARGNLTTKLTHLLECMQNPPVDLVPGMLENQGCKLRLIRLSSEKTRLLRPL